MSGECSSEGVSIAYKSVLKVAKTSPTSICLAASVEVVVAVDVVAASVGAGAAVATGD